MFVAVLLSWILLQSWTNVRISDAQFVQASVDGPTEARMWQFLPDATFIDAKSESLSFNLAALNSEAQAIVFWSMKLTMLPSGRLQSYSVFLDVPLLWVDAMSLKDRPAAWASECF